MIDFVASNMQVIERSTIGFVEMDHLLFNIILQIPCVETSTIILL